MPKIIETEVVEFDELNDVAKIKARSWYRDVWDDRDWYEFIYEDFEIICEMLGVSLLTSPVRLTDGTARRPRIYFSGFWSQGDGACFESDYCYEKNSINRIREHAPKDDELHKIAESLEAANGALSISYSHIRSIAAAITTSFACGSWWSGAAPITGT